MQGEVREVAMEFRRADGSRLDTLVNAVLRRSPGSGSTVLRLTVFDATDRRAYERELLDERRRAELVAARLRVLQEMVARCAAVERAEEIVAPIVVAATAAFEATATTVWLLDPEEAVLTVAGGTDGSAAVRAGPIALDGPEREARAVRTGDVVVSDRYRPDRRVVTPLVADDRVLGAVSVDLPEARGLAAGEVDLMRTLGQQAGQALERVRLYEETSRRAWQSAFLARLGRDLDEPVGSADRARRLVDLLVPDLAGYVEVDLATTDQAGWPVPPTGADDEVIASGTGGPWLLGDDVRRAVRDAGRSGRAFPLTAPDGRRGVVLPLRARTVVIGTLLLVEAPDATGPCRPRFPARPGRPGGAGAGQRPPRRAGPRGGAHAPAQSARR